MHAKLFLYTTQIMVRVVFLACFFSSKLYSSINILLGQSISSEISITLLDKYSNMIPVESEKYQANNVISFNFKLVDW